MKKKDLKKLSRSELLELLLAQSREAERLRGELEAARAQLEDRQINVTKAGDLAQAALQINGVMEAAQAAASQYLDNVVRMEQQTKQECCRLLRLATEEALRLTGGAPVSRGESENAFVEELYRLLEDDES